MKSSILVICVGNICRSPMAEVLMRARLPGMTLGSAGLAAVTGASAAGPACELISERGLDLSQHIARQLEEPMLRRHDLVLTMEQSQSRWITSHWPHFTGRVYRWGHWGGFDIPDPYRQSDSVYRDVLKRIDEGLTQWLKKLEALAV